MNLRKPKRVLVAGLFHETNTFLDGHTSQDDFDLRDGAELFLSEGDSSPLAGCLEVANQQGWNVLPVVDIRSMPGAIVADEVVERFWTAFRVAASESEVEGILLVLHGAMVSQSLLDVEGEVLRRIRSLPPLANVPICGVVDLHANFTEDMARYSDGLIAYRENPHTDAHAAGRDASHMLNRLMRTGERPLTLQTHASIMWPPSGTGTAEDPMRALEELARELELHNSELLAVNIFAGFPHADVPDAGVSFSVVTVGNPEDARANLKELNGLAQAMRDAGNRPGITLEEALRLVKTHETGPVLLVEPSDNIGGGAPGDNTRLLQALVEHRIADAGVVVNDPQIVRSLQEARPGERRLAAIGGKSKAVGAKPLHLEVEIISHSDGRFDVENPQSHLASISGSRIDMGRCVLTRHQGVTVLLTSRKTPPFDLGQWRSQGINPEDLFTIGVKAAAAHRHAYDPIAKGSYAIDSPGPCSENLKRLHYRHVRRPVYPLDDPTPQDCQRS